MIQTAQIFLQFFRRDLYVQLQNLKDYVINYAIIQPIIWSVLTGYLQANTYFGSTNIKHNTVLFSGTIVVTLLIITFAQSVELLFDLENTRYIDYQITILAPFLVLIERILFSSLITFCMVAPFYPISKLVLQNYIDTSNTSWLQVILLLYFGSLCCSAYHFMVMCILKSSADLDSLWKRVNAPMIDFGGMWIPWIIMYEFSHTLGYIAYANPLIYVSDGLKQAIVGGPEFFALSVCIPMLLFFTVLFTLGAWYFFKRRTDCL